jgi:hypothetical protein
MESAIGQRFWVERVRGRAGAGVNAGLRNGWLRLGDQVGQCLCPLFNPQSPELAYLILVAENSRKVDAPDTSGFFS